MTELLSKLFDLLLGGLLERQRERSEFETLRQSVLYVSTVNNYPVELHKLRTFVLSKGLIKNPAFEAFFHRWLASPWVERGTPTLNVFTLSEREQLLDELRALRI